MLTYLCRILKRLDQVPLLRDFNGKVDEMLGRLDRIEGRMKEPGKEE